MSELWPWRVWRIGVSMASLRAPSRIHAQALADKRWHPGLVARIEHETSGEEWRRIAGTWRLERAAVRWPA